MPRSDRPSHSTGPANAVAIAFVAVVVCGAVACSPTGVATPRASAVSGSPSAFGSSSEDEWQVLFDGSTVTGLRPYGDPSRSPEALPTSWEIADGRLRTIAGTGVDLVTTDVFGD